jgi:N-acetylmuramoyl-L-alanine amidase
MKIALIVGHTEAQPGAKAGPPLDKHEYPFWCEVAVDMWRIARETGLDCRIFKRDGLGVSGVAREVNAWANSESNTVSMELHFNAAMDIRARGVETLYVKDKMWAELVQREQVYSMTEIVRDNPVKPRDRGLKLLSEEDRGFSNLKDIAVPACLVEPFFGSNKLDTELFLRNKMRWSKRMIHAAVDYFLLQSKL